ncbi:hypothetical protein [Shinella zoogloeoides]|nr:hypothetical protein [Shinella zoogloeoides]WLR90885.1 hypothetical protein Q9316_00480 [Shinella zoogloeoides]
MTAELAARISERVEQIKRRALKRARRVADARTKLLGERKLANG